MEITDRARELRNAYQRAYRVKNPDKTKQYNIEYWERKATNYSIIEKARDLSQQGLTQRQIANELSISVGTVNKYLNA